MKPIISCVLLGGLGNQLFQIATVLAYIKQKNYKYILGYSSFTPKYNFGPKDIQPWGGHKLKNFKELSEIFPNLNFSKKKIKTIIEDKWFLECLISGKYIPIKITYSMRLLGYFFSNKYWHSERDYILNMLAPSEIILKYIDNKYGDLFENETVSLHMRLGYESDNFGIHQNDLEFYKNAFGQFDKNVTYLVFSDNKKKLEDWITKFQKLSSAKFVSIEEDVYYALFMMAKCNGHILHNSTLSFWGAYLDKNQPKSKTVISSKFLLNHPREIIPEEYNWTWF